MKPTQTTKSVKIKDNQRDWYLLDAKGKVLGRLAPEITKKLQGKHKRNYVSYLDCGDFVVVVNAKQVVLTGRKEMSKTYTRYSGYPGGLKTISVATMRDRNPAKMIENAVSGMLPKNKYRSDRLRRLFIFAEKDHPYSDKFVKK